ncbi:MAG: copper chaperone PCu(A)C [Rhodobacteraceae bacterium]|nr:copper chaperone PCu(A)C [Paracoccaceae bacterium]
MSRTSLVLAISIALGSALPGSTKAQIMIEDAYVRSSGTMAQSGAAFMAILNQGERDDRIISATADVAVRVELHTHLQDDNGVMRMIKVEDGFALVAGVPRMLQRGGDHLMFLGLTRPLVHGEHVKVTLTFERAAPMTITIPVDLERQDHGNMGHGAHEHHSH